MLTISRFLIKTLFEITKFAHFLSLKYGKKLTVQRGKFHDYLHMDLDYSTKGAVKISMIKYLQKIEDEFPEEITGTAKLPAGENLFQVRDDDDPDKRYLNATKAMPGALRHSYHCLLPHLSC